MPARDRVYLIPSELDLLRFMRRRRRWFKVRDIFNLFPTNSPTKRLSKLFKAEKIEKRKYPLDPRYTEYRALGGASN